MYYNNKPVHQNKILSEVGVLVNGGFQQNHPDFTPFDVYIHEQFSNILSMENIRYWKSNCGSNDVQMHLFEHPYFRSIVLEKVSN